MRYLCMILIFIANTTFAASSAKIVVSGTVPDEASKAGILAQLRQLYGAEQVIDQIEIGSVVLPANWNSYVQKLINPKLKLVRHGQLKVDGNIVNINGEVKNELQRQEIASDIATQLNSTYTVHNGLRVSELSEQNQIDITLKNRIIEFDSGKATLKPIGAAILNELSVPLLKMSFQQLEVVGHTDSLGLRINNIALSKDRAETVKAYLSNKGVIASKINTSGKGPDMPIASNDTAEGRARNRRIEFRILQ